MNWITYTSALLAAACQGPVTPWGADRRWAKRRGSRISSRWESRSERGRGPTSESLAERPLDRWNGKEYRLMPDFDEWLRAFGDALAAQGTKLIETAPGQWSAHPS